VATKPPIRVEVRLLPPLGNTAGRERVTLTLTRGATIQTVIDELLRQFDDPVFRLHLYDTEGRLIPAWRAFINEKPGVRIASREGLSAPVADGDEITFLLSLAGG
jgi:molybdopterin converting factor small subunit